MTYRQVISKPVTGSCKESLLPTMNGIIKDNYCVEDQPELMIKTAVEKQPIPSQVMATLDTSRTFTVIRTRHKMANHALTEKERLILRKRGDYIGKVGVRGKKGTI